MRFGIQSQSFSAVLIFLKFAQQHYYQAKLFWSGFALTVAADMVY